MPTLAVSHTLQYVGLRVDHSELRSGRPGWVTAIAYADFDLDGDIDVFHAPVVESGAPQPVEFHVNNGNNEFSLHDGLLNGAAPRLSNATKAVSGDYNGDGRADIVVVGAGRSGNDRGIYLILSSPDGYRLGSGLDYFAGTYYTVASADMDADGDVDLFLPGFGVRQAGRDQRWPGDVHRLAGAGGGCRLREGRRMGRC